MNQKVVLEIKDIQKSFGEVHVLRGINLNIREGEIHALVGENGAGKSTIIKIICGVYEKDSGEILLDGQNIEFTTPKQAMDEGIRVIHQEINMVSTLTVAENIFLGNFPKTEYGKIDWNQLRDDAKSVMGILGEEIDVNEKVSNVSIAEQQMIEIAKAVSVQPKILIMDEPTAALNDQETEKLFELLDRLKSTGVAIIYITHRFSEIYRLADRVTIMRDGESIKTLDIDEVTDDVMISMMVGEEKASKYQKRDIAKGEELFRVDNLNVKDMLDNINLSIHKGEIAVIFGLVGAGQTELCRTLFGDLPYQSGTITLHGKELKINSIKDACKAGIGYASDDRKKEGIIPLLSIQENISLPSYPGKLSNALGFIKRKSAKEVSLKYYEKLHIKSAGLGQAIGSLSGGNQQKGLICRWLANDVKLLILNMPTRGVDVGSRAEIYRTLEELADNGVAVLIVSQEMPEVISIADTIYVMHEAKITAKIDRKEVTQELLMKAALGIELGGYKNENR